MNLTSFVLVTDFGVVSIPATAPIAVAMRQTRKTKRGRYDLRCKYGRQLREWERCSLAASKRAYFKGRAFKPKMSLPAAA